MHFHFKLSMLCTPLLVLNLVSALHAQEISFERTQLDDKFRSEGVAVGDFNKDGKLDIAAGLVWYEAPDWNMHGLTEEIPEHNPKGYSHSFCTFADDLNNDGWTDVLVVDFPGTPTWWLENPQETGKTWNKHVLTPVTNNESPTYLDFTGDGQPELVAGVNPDPKNPDGPQRFMAYMTPGEKAVDEWTINRVSIDGAPGTRKYYHGLGTGDVNGDGHQDILCAHGWWEAPETTSEAPWPWHAADFGGKAAQMYVYDFDDDGDSDVLNSSPHAFGLWWHEQVAENQWKTHEIDNSYSQLHGVCFADINGDDLPDIITGKRWWAHGGGDPGGDQPAVLYWYEFSRENGKPTWTPHLIDRNSGEGTQFEVTDVDADGLLDIVTSNKKGVHYFRQVRK